MKKIICILLSVMLILGLCACGDTGGSQNTDSDTLSQGLNVFSVGEIGFVNGSYEMFSEAGMYIKEYSPFDTTVIMEGCSSYIPSAEAYDYRSYEADTGCYAKGTSEKLAEKFVEMLTALK